MMAYLLDTCALSDGSKSLPNPQLLSWLESRHEAERYVSAISLGEIMYGIFRLPAGRKRVFLSEWYDDVLRPIYEGRILPFGEGEAMTWARLRSAYPNCDDIDSQIAATAIAHNLTLVTRNVKDFAFEGLSVINPWNSES
jgi:predicted nucleic acid-binding protein